MNYIKSDLQTLRGDFGTIIENQKNGVVSSFNKTSDNLYKNISKLSDNLLKEIRDNSNNIITKVGNIDISSLITSIDFGKSLDGRDGSYRDGTEVVVNGNGFIGTYKIESSFLVRNDENALVIFYVVEKDSKKAIVPYTLVSLPEGS